jgi:hypothetical protein
MTNHGYMQVAFIEESFNLNLVKDILFHIVVGNMTSCGTVAWEDDFEQELVTIAYKHHRIVYFAKSQGIVFQEERG